MQCPKCSFQNRPAAVDCVRCGVVFSKWKEMQDFPPVVPRPDRLAPLQIDDRVTNGRIGPSELKIMGSGLLAASIVYALPFTRFVFSALVTLFHELGHAIAGWLMGYPSLPAFDFVYGGGLTHHGEFNLAVAVLIGGIFGYGAWLLRGNRRTLILIGALFGIWLALISAEWRRELTFASAGHLFEYVLAGIFFYMALSGVGWRHPDLERPLGAFVAFFVQIHSVMFALRLRNDPEFLSWYREGKGGALMNDLELVAADLNIYLKINLGIEGVAALLLLFSFVPMAVALLWYLNRWRCHSVVDSFIRAA